MEQYWDPVWGAVARPPKDNTVWIWDVVGDNLIIVKIPREVSWFRRFKTKMILGSKWTRIKKRGN